LYKKNYAIEKGHKLRSLTDSIRLPDTGQPTIMNIFLNSYGN